jgi:hypothetical protein
VLQDFGPLLPRVKVPTLLVWGAEDKIAPRRILNALADALPNSQVEIFEGVGHLLPAEAPDRLASRILELSAKGAVEAPSPRAARVSTRVGRCHRERGVVFEGDYDSIEIVGCRDVLLRSVRARKVTVLRSSVTLEHTWIEGRGTALTLHRSTALITGGGLEGEVAVCASRSHLDVAGTRITGRREAVDSPNRAHFLFSITSLEGAQGLDFFHGPKLFTRRTSSARGECFAEFERSRRESSRASD